jgi:hypothetical protein
VLLLFGFVIVIFTSKLKMTDKKHSDALDHADEKRKKLKDSETSLQPVDDQDDPTVKRIKRKVDFRLSAILAVRLWNNSSRNLCANANSPATLLRQPNRPHQPPKCVRILYPSTAECKAHIEQARGRYG